MKWSLHIHNDDYSARRIWCAERRPKQDKCGKIAVDSEIEGGIRAVLPASKLDTVQVSHSASNPALQKELPGRTASPLLPRQSISARCLSLPASLKQCEELHVLRSLRYCDCLNSAKPGVVPPCRSSSLNRFRLVDTSVDLSTTTQLRLQGSQSTTNKRRDLLQTIR